MFITTFAVKNVLGIALAAMASGTVPSTIPTSTAAVLATATNVAFDQVQDYSNEPAIELAEPVREEAVRTFRVPVTAYSSTPDQCDSTPFITANGSHVRDGIIAANFLPFKTRVRMPELFGDKVFTVEDRMNRRYPYRADVWMEKRSDAVKFGLKRNVLIEVLPPEREVVLAE